MNGPTPWNAQMRRHTRRNMTELTISNVSKENAIEVPHLWDVMPITDTNTHYGITKIPRLQELHGISWKIIHAIEIRCFRSKRSFITIWFRNEFHYDSLWFCSSWSCLGPSMFCSSSDSPLVLSQLKGNPGGDGSIIHLQRSSFSKSQLPHSLKTVIKSLFKWQNIPYK